MPAKRCCHNAKTSSSVTAIEWRWLKYASAMASGTPMGAPLVRTTMPSPSLGMSFATVAAPTENAPE
jgi:hypothetical protein